VLTVLALLLVGVAIGQFRWLPDGASGLLDAVVIRFSLPALILAVLPQVDLDSTLVVPVVAAWGTTIVLATLVWVLTAPLHLDPRVRATMLLVVPLGNTSFLGFPAVEALLGPSHLPAAVVYDQLGTFLALVTFGTVVAGRFGAGPSPTLRSVLRRVVMFPPFVALVVAVVAMVAGGLPGPVAEVAEVLGATVTPLAMLAVGARIRFGGGAWRPGLLTLGLGLRMVLAPALVLSAAHAVDGAGIVWETAVLEAAMPPMVIAGVMAADADLDAELAARLVGVGVLLAMVTLPLWAALVT
jgi:malate permease and related proteins